MPDISNVTEKVEKRITSGETSTPFKIAMGSLRISKTEEKNEEGLTDVNSILTKVYAWENKNLDKVKPEEIESLEILSSILQTMDVGIEREKTGKLSDQDFADLTRVNTQREIVKTVFKNLTPENLPNDQIIRSFSLIAYIFEDNLKPTPDRLFEQGLEKEIGFWQGTLGMVSTALMFDKCGWEVGFGDPWLDIKYDADLIVTDPQGRRYTVDVTAKSVYDEGPRYTIEKSSTVRSDLLRFRPDLSGSITINVPPLRTIQFSLESSRFYDKKHLSCGCPSELAMEKFRDVINA